MTFGRPKQTARADTERKAKKFKKKKNQSRRRHEQDRAAGTQAFELVAHCRGCFGQFQKFDHSQIRWWYKHAYLKFSAQNKKKNGTVDPVQTRT